MDLSIIIVTWNNENFIEQALRSCLHDGPRAYEVIVVDNASEDRTGEIVRRVVASCGVGVRYVRSDANLGPGPARNIGMRAARGRHLMFLDGDDFFSPGAFARVHEVIDRADPQLIVFNHARMYEDGTYRRNSMTHALGERDASSPASRTSLMRNFSVAWNKVYRRDFLDQLAVEFADGIYEDVSWSFRTQVLAATVYAIPDVLVNYRQRTGSITKSLGPQHFDVLKEYDAVLSLLRQDPDHQASYGKPVYQYAREQILHVGVAPGRVPPHLKNEYVAQAVAALRRWRRQIGIEGSDRLLSLAEVGGYRALDAAIKVRKVRDAATRQAKRLTASVRRVRALGGAVRARSIQMLHAVACRTRPLEPKKVLFEAYWGKKADCNPLAICEELDRIGGFDIVWSFADAALVPVDFKHRWVVRGSYRMMWEAATAKYLVSNTNLPDAVRKRPGSVHLQTWHGTPLKVMGLDIRPRNPKEMNWARFAKRSRRWDYVISSNPYSSYTWRRACPYDYKMLETGYPRNDALLNAPGEAIAALKASMGLPLDKKIALYAPTIRDGSKGKALMLSPEAFDAERVARALGDDYVLLIRAHYFNGQAGVGSTSVVDVSSHPSSNEVLLVSDVLITDYSSIQFDYATLLRPIVLYVHDYEAYLRDRGVYFDITQEAPGPVARTQDELLDVLSSRRFLDPEHEERLRAFRDRFAPWDDGGATRRVVEQVFGPRGAERHAGPSLAAGPGHAG